MRAVVVRSTALLMICMMIMGAIAHRACSDDAVPMSEYYPLAAGNSWEYEYIHEDETVDLPWRTSSIVEEMVHSLPDTRYRMMTRKHYPAKTDSMYNWMSVTADGNVVFNAFGPTPEMVIIEFDPPITVLSGKSGDTEAGWKNTIEQIEYEGDIPQIRVFDVRRIVSRDETVTVPAGTFDKCLVVQSVAKHSDGETSIITSYHARGVGTVLTVSERSVGPDYRIELTSFLIQEP
jgi:hypothetical protein